MKLIVGLGNPGEKYAANRHNIGFLVLDELVIGYRCSPWKKRFQGLVSEGQIGTQKCILLKPATYMNESGRAVGEAMRFYKLGQEDVIVIHDELDLKPGQVRVKAGGGNAGHNGLKSISAYIGNDYKRLRLGIGHPGDKTQVANYVLQDFAKADKAWLTPLIEAVAKGMSHLVDGSDAAFLNEAARSRPATSAAETAHKANGSANAAATQTPEPIVMRAEPRVEAALAKTLSDAAPDMAGLEALLAVSSKPIEAMPKSTFTPATAPKEEVKAEPATVIEEEKAAEPEGIAEAKVPEPELVRQEKAAEPESAAEENGVKSHIEDVVTERPGPIWVMPVAAREGGSNAISAPALSGTEKEEAPAQVFVSEPEEITPSVIHTAAQRKGLGGKLKSWLHGRVRGTPSRV